MKITRGQASLIADLQARLFSKLDIKIGYSHPGVTIIPDDVDFIICEPHYENDEQEDDISLVHKDDLIVEWVDDSTMKIFANAEPQHDNKVEDFVNNIYGWLTDGTLWFDPSITCEVDGITVSVTKKLGISDQDPVYNTNLNNSGHGAVYRYGQIAFAAKLDKRFRALKKVIDKTWPKDRAGFSAKMKIIHPNPEAAVEALPAPVKPKPNHEKPSILTIAKNLAKYLINKINEK